MQKLVWLLVAFALLVAGIESLHVLVAWWQAGRPAPGMAEGLSCAALIVVGVAWWRHSVFTCRNDCLLPPQPGAPSGEAARPGHHGDQGGT